MRDSPGVFCCPVCQVVITRPLLAMSEGQQICVEDGKAAVPEGRFGTSNDYWPASGGYIFVNLADLVGTKRHPDPHRLNGCCGLDGCDGPNLVCENGHEVATERSDCWMAHAAILVQNVARSDGTHASF
jgi:hypothetical protein